MLNSSTKALFLLLCTIIYFNLAPALLENFPFKAFEFLTLDYLKILYKLCLLGLRAQRFDLKIREFSLKFEATVKITCQILSCIRKICFRPCFTSLQKAHTIGSMIDSIPLWLFNSLQSNNSSTSVTSDVWLDYNYTKRQLSDWIKVHYIYKKKIVHISI